MKPKTRKFVQGVCWVCAAGAFVATLRAQPPNPSLCLTVSPGDSPNGACHTPGSLVTVMVGIGASQHSITGGQFGIDYDTTAWDVVGMATGAVCGPNSPFMEIFELIDDPNGFLFYAAGMPFGQPGTSSAVTLACITFRAVRECGTDPFCVVSQNPYNTYLVDQNAQAVIPEFNCPNGSCSGSVVVSDSIDFDCPSDFEAEYACGSILWPTPGASSCGDGLSLSCSAAHSGGQNIDGLIAGGGAFPRGVSTFICSAQDSCGRSDQCQWTVTIPQANPPNCNDQVSCTVDVCDVLTGCGHTASDALCDDENPCTDDSCDSLTGCRNTLNQDPCNAGCNPPSACADNVPDGVSVLLNPGGGGNDPTLDALVEFTNLSGAPAWIMVTETIALHPNSGGFSMMGKTLLVSVFDELGTTLTAGAFLLRVALPIDEPGLGGADPLSVRPAWFNPATQPNGAWNLAVAGNAQPSPGHEPGVAGDVFESTGVNTPSIASLSVDVGDYGVFWNTATMRGFTWANVDHASDFAGGSCVNRVYADLFPVAGDGIVELGDVLCMLLAYADAQACPGSDIAPCGGDGITELADILSLLFAYSGQPPCPDRCP